MVSRCSSCEDKLCEKDFDLVEDFQISVLEALLKCLDTLKYKQCGFRKRQVRQLPQPPFLNMSDKLSQPFEIVVIFKKSFHRELGQIGGPS